METVIAVRAIVAACLGLVLFLSALVDLVIAEIAGAGLACRLAGSLFRGAEARNTGGLDGIATTQIFRSERSVLYWSIVGAKLGMGALLLTPLTMMIVRWVKGFL